MPGTAITLSPMGVFTVRIRVYSLRDEGRVREVEAIVDTGALFPVFPREFLADLGAERIETRRFVLANGEEIRRDVAQLGLEYEGHRAPTLVILGEPGDASVLGALALEGLGYEADAVHKRLRPTTLYLLGLGTRPESQSSTA
jgi:predicted aspartyl protease